ncbi:ectonucleotide pyrophosphatase/phosphodiesterase family member 5-like protein, partial [Dinothrombium tinctorium]
MLYFNQPDYNGHRYGASSQKVYEAVIEVDRIIGMIISGLKYANKLNKINLLVVSDHGMTNLTMPSIDLLDYISKNDTLAIESWGVIAGVEPKPAKLAKVFNQLQRASAHLKIYLKEDIPERYHYKHHKLIKSIVVVADEGYIVVVGKKKIKQIADHGYDNELRSMRPIFFARGPDFKQSYKAEIFPLIDIYPLMCHLMGLKEAPNNGTLRTVRSMLRSDSSSSSTAFSSISTLLWIIKVVTLQKAIRQFIS